MKITIETTTNTATLDAPVIMKAGSQIPVTVTFLTDGTPAVLGGAPAIQIGLGKPSVPSGLLAYLEVFTAGAGSSFTGTLDGTDSRLGAYMSALAQATVNLEVAWTMGGAEYIAQNLAVTVQQQLLTGPQTSEGGPTYLTTAQLQATLAALLPTVLAGLPAADPHTAGALYRSGDFFAISNG